MLYHIAIQIAGHQDVIRTLHRLFEKIYLEKTQKLIKNLLQSVDMQLAQGELSSPYSYEKYPICSRPFERISMDIVGKIRSSDSGIHFILTIVDSLTRFTILVLLPNKTESVIAETLFQFVIVTYQTPSIINDNVKEFTRVIMSEFCKKRCKTNFF